MIVDNDWLGTAVGELIRSELAPIAHWAKVSGPHIAIGPQVSQSLALLVHELAMDAMHRNIGSLAISWKQVYEEGAPCVVITWTEDGGTDFAGEHLAHQIAAHGFATPISRNRRGSATSFVFSVPLD